jgi:hypothetical protein
MWEGEKLAWGVFAAPLRLRYGVKLGERRMRGHGVFTRREEADARAAALEASSPGLVVVVAVVEYGIPKLKPI